MRSMITSAFPCETVIPETHLYCTVHSQTLSRPTSRWQPTRRLAYCSTSLITTIWTVNIETRLAWRAYSLHWRRSRSGCHLRSPLYVALNATQLASLSTEHASPMAGFVALKLVHTGRHMQRLFDDRSATNGYGNKTAARTFKIICHTLCGLVNAFEACIACILHSTIQLLFDNIRQGRLHPACHSL